MGSIAPEDEEVTVEVRDAPPGHYLLKIESFSLLSESGNDKFESNEFEAAGYKWKSATFSTYQVFMGLAKFLSHDTFKEASNGYLVDGKCVLGAEIFVVQRQAIGECLSTVKSNSSFKRELKICNFSNLNEN
ncbi:hypothetical protein R3W88_020009 [Solanum pinnatisectum]|uniref:MATH domain-containing protein n=1 Tax=Solanum pinnatisectum TaxID=50273 RepID=A0AAV9KPX0_9SOLN|nr:hypothetical protein R3W88_020009 [Solanum pinnatisectum]